MIVQIGEEYPNLSNLLFYHDEASKKGLEEWVEEITKVDELG